MENVTKQWHKIMFAEDESPLGKPWQVTKQASQIHQASGLPREFAIFMELRDGARPVLYFSPIAAELCAELISSFEGAACSLPTDPMPSFTMAYGNAEEAWALVARDTPREERREAFDQHKSAQADTASKAQFIKIDPLANIGWILNLSHVEGDSLSKNLLDVVGRSGEKSCGRRDKTTFPGNEQRYKHNIDTPAVL